MSESVFGGSAGRWVLLAGGVLLAGAGLRLRSWPRLVLVLAGSAGVYRAVCAATPRRIARTLEEIGAGVSSGIYDDVAQAAREAQAPAGTLIEDIVEVTSDDSFPCSDPPSWAGGRS